MPKNVTVAVTQFSCTWDIQSNLDKAEKLIRKAAAKGAQIILVQELFETPYFCIDMHPKYYSLAKSLEESQAVGLFRSLAKELDVVLPCSFFEKAGNVFYNSVAVVDAGGEILGVYRKTHIPDDPGYLEKYYFTPGDTGFSVWKTSYASIGIGICWDQWFPETARCLALGGAELLFFPTAIGSEPGSAVDTQSHWTITQQGHSAANILPVIAANRTGTEKSAIVENCEIEFYGSSFITDHLGSVVAQASRNDEALLTHTFDLEAIKEARDSWYFFRDRRPEMYTALLTSDGKTLSPTIKNRFK